MVPASMILLSFRPKGRQLGRISLVYFFPLAVVSAIALAGDLNSSSDEKKPVPSAPAAAPATRAQAEEIHQINEVIGRVGEAVTKINTAMDQVRSVTEENAANSEESASVAEELSGQAKELQALVKTFSLSQINYSSPAKPVERTSWGMDLAAAADPGVRSGNGSSKPWHPTKRDGRFKATVPACPIR